MTAQYALGIDLGTTNSVVAYASLQEETPQIQLLPIPQLVDVNTVEERSALTSFIYLAGGAAHGNLDVPWSSEREFAVGEFARQQAAEHPERTVSAAKSWLSHGRVDRRAAILPWGAVSDVDKISPVEAAVRYLAHLVAGTLVIPFFNFLVSARF